MYALIAGFVLSYFTEHSGVIPTCLLHVLNNLVALTSAFTLSGCVLFYGPPPPRSPAALCSLAVFAAALALLRAEEKPKAT